MEYIMMGLGTLVILALICLILMLFPIIFNLFVIGVDEFIKLCSWLRHRVQMNKLDKNKEMIITKEEYEVLCSAFDSYHGIKIDDLEDVQ